MRISRCCATIPPHELSALRFARPSGESVTRAASIRAAFSACPRAVAIQPVKARLSDPLVMPAMLLRSSRSSSQCSFHELRPATSTPLAQRLSAQRNRPRS